MPPVHYDPQLVLLSVAIACLASYATLSVAARVEANGRRLRTPHLLGSALVMGFGIWAMHFIGMLAHRLPVPVGYDTGTVVLSAVVGTLGAALALWMVGVRPLTRTRLLCGGCLLGLGIVIMHYVGMAAMRLPGTITYQPVLVGFSVWIALVAATVALWLAHYFENPDTLLQRRLRLLASLVLGLAIVGMHYTAMAAAHFHVTAHPVPQMGQGAQEQSHLMLARSIAVVTSVLILAALSTLLMERRLAHQLSAVREGERRNEALEARVSERTGELNARHNELNALIDAVPALLWHTDEAGQICRANTAVAAATGLAPDGLLGRSAKDVLPRLDAHETEQQVIRSGEARLGEVVEVALQDAPPRWYRVDKVPFRGVDGRITGVITLAFDVTDLVQVQTELQRSNAELEQFAYIASHDLQAPLRAVTSFAGLLERRYSGQLDERARTYLEHIMASGQHMKRLVDELLSFSRVTTHRRPPKPVPLRQVVDDTLSRLTSDIAAVAGEVTYENLPTVMGDASQLGQLFQNLISNALKYHRAGVAPQVRLRAEQEGKLWHFTVTDNGIGIEKQYFERIFQVFQRLHPREQFEGTGIGLALCLKIVQHHGGRLWVESTPGEGSTFHFTLSASPEDAVLLKARDGARASRSDP
ncbi:PAS domain S-box-containing protein [Deinococcus hopiensis KR-140]|uniref:histidine kinase n=2 Tax=Deinococcus TaxID=1298 RepID=A0A1W1VV41_9DEIO|nr:PAS domain S-box-containing protein [Deinococcus hopiensis KR-140]